MQENNKYYTPSIEEFHVGFEYEAQDLHNNLAQFVWRKQVYEGEEMRTYLAKELERNEIRVKYLDQEDIESLRWSNQGQEQIYSMYVDDVGYNLIGYNIPNKWELRCHHPSIQFGGFYGIIKNKSELRKLMQQLGICK